MLVEYAPDLLGADCSHCILSDKGKPRRPVPPELNAGATFAAIGEAPGVVEAEAGKPFRGQSGIEWERAIRAAGLRRKRFAIFNALACRPADVVGGEDTGSWQRMDAKLHAINRGRKGKGAQPYPHPIDCCRGRLLKELVPYNNVIAMGGSALQALTGRRTAITDQRGDLVRMRRGGLGPAGGKGDKGVWFEEPVDGLDEASPLQGLPLVKVLPTFHPAYVARDPRWRSTAISDVKKAVRFFEDRLTWRDPEMIFQPSWQQAAEFLGVVRDRVSSDGWRATPGKGAAFDFETDSLEPVRTVVRCLGIGGAKRVMVLPFASVEKGKGPAPFYSADDRARIKDIAAAWLRGPRLKVGHNATNFDTAVSEAFFGVVPIPIIDTMLLHKVVQPDLPHGLAYLGSILTDIRRWKRGDPGVNARSDLELWVYNGLDVAVTATIFSILLRLAAKHEVGGIRPEALRAMMRASPP